MGLIKMKALSIKQPWAWLIVHGYKDIENRRWSTRFRGRFLIHAGQTFDWAGYKWLVMNRRKLGLIDLPSPASVFYHKGGIVGEVELIDCVTTYDSPWFFGPYGFILQNARETRFYPLKGELRFFEV